MGSVCFPSVLPWGTVVIVCLCFRLLFAFRSGSAFDSLGSSLRSLWRLLLSGLVVFFPLVCLHQVVWVPAHFLSMLFWAFPCHWHSVGSWGCELYLAGLGASSPRSPSVLILLVLPDLDGSSQLGDIPVAVKSRLTGSPENVIYCVGISPS